VPRKHHPGAAADTTRGAIAAAVSRRWPPWRRAATRYRSAALPKLRSSIAAPELHFAATPKLGTGHGEREYSYVTNTEFDRMQAQPDEVIRIRYDSLDNLRAAVA